MAMYDEQILGAKQQAELARKLRENAKMPEGQMVSGWHVAPSATQYAAELMKQYFGRKGEAAANENLANILKQREDAGNKWMGEMPTAQTSAAVPETQTPVFESGTNQMVANALRGGQEPQMSQANTTPQDPSMLSAMLRGEQPQQMPMEHPPLPQQTGVQVNPAQPAVTTQPTEQQYEQWLMRGNDIDPAKAQIAMAMMKRRDDAASKRELMGMTFAEKQAEAQRQREFQQTMAQGNQANARAIAQMGIQAKQDATQNQPVKLNPTIEKEIFQADELANASQNTISLLEQAKQLNKQPTYSGYSAAGRAALRNNLPGQSQEASNTVQLNNMMTGQALESLKATFGGNPTEGERAILLELQASADKTPKDREEIMSRAIKMAEQRMKFNSNKAEQLRSGGYFKPNAPVIPAPMQPKGTTGEWAMPPQDAIAAELARRGGK